jgi:hypothetical protein
MKFLIIITLILSPVLVSAQESPISIEEQQEQQFQQGRIGGTLVIDLSNHDILFARKLQQELQLNGPEVVMSDLNENVLKLTYTYMKGDRTGNIDIILNKFGILPAEILQR